MSDTYMPMSSRMRVSARVLLLARYAADAAASVICGGLAAKLSASNRRDWFGVGLRFTAASVGLPRFAGPRHLRRRANRSHKTCLIRDDLRLRRYPETRALGSSGRLT